MAGESPDKAEQQGSSQETAAASGGGGRDPRLSVLRESEPASSAAEPSDSPVRVDQPTAVFKTLTPRTSGDDAPEGAEPESAAAPVSASEPESTSAPESEPEGERLKAAVAAWVATAAEEPGRAAGTAEEAPGGPGEAPEAAETAEEPRAGAEPGAGAGAGAEDDATGEDEPEAEAVEPAGAVEPVEAVEADASGEDVEGDEAAKGTEGATAVGAAEGAEAVGDAGGAGGASAAGGTGAVGDTEGAEGAGTGGGAKAVEVAEAAKGKTPVEEKASADEETSVEDKTPADEKAPVDSWFAARKPAAEAKSAPAKAPEPAGNSSGSGNSSDSEGSSSPEGVSSSSESGGSEGVSSSGGSEASGGSSSPRASGSPSDSGSSGGSEDDETPVDQPTAMFKMIRPPVDQPTTALKLPAGSVGTGADTDPDSERTSTFLPLRPDIPAERKAPEAESAPEAPAPAPVPPALAEPERTRQQPLPPLPPLDLLAELTNTPPPPPSPLRTTLRRVRIWTPLVLLLLIVFAIAQMVRPLPAPALKLSAAPTYTFEGGELKMPWPGEGQGAVEVEGVGSMGAYGPQKPAPIASVTKTMTAYVILRDHPLRGKQNGPEIEIDKKAADQGKAEHESTAAVQEGQTYSQKELLQLLMIPSANNVARLLARWDAGSEAAFVEKMNAAAKELGMTQSTYTDPSGLLDSTVSTPKDQLKLAKAVMQYDVFREIVNMPNVTVEGIPGRIENNNNILLKPGVGGIKTGSSTPAGGNLLWSANTIVDGQNRRILGIVMGAKNAQYLGDKLQLSIDYSYELIKRAQKDVTSAAVVRKGQVLGYVDDGLGGKTPVVATKELKAVGWPGLKVELDLTDGGRAVPHSGKAGDVVGQVSIGTGAGRVSSPVALQADLVEPGFDKKLTRVG
ncbi:D-alanyl-D-alanine carboxypeptidase family protein [Streptomyces sp. NPDC085463]|uniref:D-alanyl-D-alanine carboxypeptidase family protein n=1 Tax=Streptomyces sp. NPDC085463 TaxID=3365724 RepID=UPI0037D64821